MMKDEVHPATGGNPRNPWTRLRSMLGLLKAGQLHDAARHLEMVRYHPDMSAQVFEVYSETLRAAALEAHYTAPVNIPSDYTGAIGRGLRKPFRQIKTGATPPQPYPAGLALPNFAGGRNDLAFLHDAATVLAPSSRAVMPGMDVYLAVDDSTDVAAVAQALASQRGKVHIRLVVLCDAERTLPDLPGILSPLVVRDTVLGLEAHARMRRLLEETASDVTVFLSGQVVLDDGFVRRACFLPQVSETVVQPLVSGPQDAVLRPLTGWHQDHTLMSSRFPYRDVEGLNFVAPTALMRRVGLPDTRFSSTYLAAREICWRMFHAGAYFQPLAVPVLARHRDKAAEAGDGALFVALCPSHWDRKQDALFERPRVDVYIPAYNARKYIRQAVDSVLEQDVRDLQVCIADDGSTDGTYEMLQDHYGDNPQVRLETGLNGGIGHASNRAIRLGQAPYIGQLDSDDRLKPGAVRRLMTWLDDNPQAACVYGSCERIDADGGYIKNEYSWPVFSREKMMITSIAHHFRMFRRAAWERTTHFREDIVNAVDYDIFLKLAETGTLHHIDEVLYQRRWHGENTSNVNESFQTTNTYVVQNETLGRLGLSRFWQVHVPDPKQPRRVGYRRTPGVKTVLFWPNYSRVNPYQHMLYGKMRDHYDVCAAPIDVALAQLATFEDPADLTFHLHWINFVLNGVTDATVARDKADTFLRKVEQFVTLGGRLVWTVHNALSHESPFADIEVMMSRRLAELAHSLHFHSAASVAEVETTFEVPRDKLRISRHGHYIGGYPDFITPAQARAQLGLAAEDDVILFSGQVRAYKGIENLVAVFRKILAERPTAILLIAGEVKTDLAGALETSLSAQEQARIRMTNRFIDDMEMQVFMRAADFAVYPYHKILTSGSLLLALSFGVPVIIPSVGMTREVLEGHDAGVLYDAENDHAALEGALRRLLARKDAGTLEQMRANARALAETQHWPDFTDVIKAT
mgnify:CR=1 FL=1